MKEKSFIRRPLLGLLLSKVPIKRPSRLIRFFISIRFRTLELFASFFFGGLKTPLSSLKNKHHEKQV